MLVLQHFNLESKLGCWFSSISIWNPNWGVGFTAFQFGIQIEVLLFHHFNLESKLGCCFSTISIWNPNWGVVFPPIETCVNSSFWNPQQQKQTTNSQRADVYRHSSPFVYSPIRLTLAQVEKALRSARVCSKVVLHGSGGT